ncbi:MAG TPA: arylsulfotransferase family protein [Pirellulales bacterium]|nr:arylsulfotransferase family protein [Pirellulales bacterium]
MDRPGKTFDGFTLYAHTALADKKELATEAHLIDMRRQVVHRWSVPFSKVFPNPTHLRSRVPDEFACFFDCRLLPNGDLLAVFHALSIAGCGLARLDKDSNVLWAYPAGVHHDIDVGEDGHIYAIQREEAYELPVDLERLAPPCKLDYLVVLSADGELLRGPISVLNAFRGTAYEVLLATLETPSTQFVLPADSTAPRMDYQATTTDPLHTNCVRVLNSALAGRFPQFRAGDVLLSLRNLSVIAMLNLETGKIVWAARGPWYAQHDAQFLDNGHLLLFDNLGVPQKSRVLEYDPRTQAFPWSYSGEGGGTFFTSERGMCQRLPNGNTLIVVSESGELIEVTQDKEVVWSCSAGGSVSTARRYAADQLPFLSGDQRARP